MSNMPFLVISSPNKKNYGPPASLPLTKVITFKKSVFLFIFLNNFILDGKKRENQPIDVNLVLDISGSMVNKIKNMIRKQFFIIIYLNLNLVLSFELLYRI